MDNVDKVKLAEIKLAAFYAEHNITLQTVDNLIPLLKEICCNPQVVQNLALSRTKCAQIIKNVIAKVEDEKTIKNLRRQKFSVLVDKKVLILQMKKCYVRLVKYVLSKSKECITELLELLSLDATDCSAEKLYSAFEHCFKNKKILLE